LLALAAAAMTGVATGLVVWVAWPRRFVAEAMEQREKARSPAEAARRVLFDRMAPLVSPLVTQKRASRLQQQIVMMGAPDLRPVDIVTMQILSAIFFGVMTAMFLHLNEMNVLYGLVGLAVGALLPPYWVRQQIQRRHTAIGRAMPFNLDLMTLSVEAGLDFGGAVATVVQKGLPGPFNEELGIVLREIRMGRTREEALRNMANRARYAPLTQFVSNLVQAERMGTSLGRILRIQATQLRIQRTQRAEKLANEAPVKMLFPLIFCIFPTVFMILFGPIAYQLMTGGY